MEGLSSFAISIAANIICSLYPKNTLEKEIRKAFEEAVAEWCPNEDIRRHRESDLHGVLSLYMEHPDLSIEALDQEMQVFIAIFQRHIATYSAASNYLGEIRSQKYYDVICKQLQTMDRKIEDISKILEENCVRNEELHDEAIIEVNTILDDGIVDQIANLLDGIVHLFGDSFVTTELTADQTVVIRVDSGSRWLEDEDGELYQPKCLDLDYNWEQEKQYDWRKLSAYDVSEILSDTYFAYFQIGNLNFNNSINCLKEVLNQTSINEQLNIEEKKQINYIIQNTRAIQSIIDNYKWIFVPTNLRFINLSSAKSELPENPQSLFGQYDIIYNDGEYTQDVDEVLFPVKFESQILEVWIINPDFNIKLSGYLSEIISSIVEWEKISQPH